MLNLDRMKKRPSFPTLEQERTFRKQRLTGALRIFAEYGYTEGVAGHITVRDPEYDDHFWVNPYGMNFSQIKVSDLILVNHQGEVVQGAHHINNGAFAIHSQVHVARPDVEAIAHSHSLYGKVWASLGRVLDPISQESCMFYKDHVVFGDKPGLVVDTEEGKVLAEALGSAKACVMINHGLLTVGKSVEEAAFWFISMERCCQAQIIAESVGKPKVIDHERAVFTRDQLAAPEQAWFYFQPLWDHISKTQPDLFD